MHIYIDGRKYEAKPDQTILQAALENNIPIPSMCHMEGLSHSGACGLCVVEIEGTPRFARACHTMAKDGMAITTNTPKILAARKHILEMMLSTHMGDCKAPCQLACPAGSDCQGYIALIAAGELEEAAWLMLDAHPFPSSIARICPRPCEAKCRRGLVDEPINIAGLRRYAADWQLAQRRTRFHYGVRHKKRTKRIAIVGGGPAGLTAAFFLTRLGHKTEVFEAMPKMGGLLRYGIPEYRLPKAVLDAELEALENMGVFFINNMRLGVDITLEALCESYNAVVLAIGASKSKSLGCPGEDLPGVFGGVDFLKAVAINAPPYIGQRVVVIGGSNTAMDAARTALRLGASDVTVAYRRTRDEMPAERAEVEEALQEGLRFMFLAAPIRVTEENGRANGMWLQKMELGEPDNSGRRRPVPVDGADEWISATAIIAAIGQDVDMEGLQHPAAHGIGAGKYIEVDEHFATNMPGVFGIGDATWKTSYAIEAIGHGRAAAVEVHTYLAKQRGADAAEYAAKIGLPWDVLPGVLVRDEKSAADLAHIPKQPRQNGASNIGETLNFTETHATITPAQAAAEAARCLSCGCVDYHGCKLMTLANEYDANPDATHASKKPTHPVDRNNLTNLRFHRDMHKCVLCGICVRVCDEMAGRGAISAIHRGFDTSIGAAFDIPIIEHTDCNLCGNCAAFCPVGALTEVMPTPKPIVVNGNIQPGICAFCGNGCKVYVAAIGSQVLRILPCDNKPLCERGRYAFHSLPQRLPHPYILRDGLPRRATLEEAALTASQRVNALLATYGADSIAIAISPTYPQEEIEVILEYARHLGTPHVFTFNGNVAETAPPRPGITPSVTACNTMGLISLGISTHPAPFLAMIESRAIRGLLAFGTPPEGFARGNLDFLAIHTPYPAPLLKTADVMFPANTWAESNGYLVSIFGETQYMPPIISPEQILSARRIVDMVMQ